MVCSFFYKPHSIYLAQISDVMDCGLSLYPFHLVISLGINVTSAFCSFPLWLWKSHQVGGYWDKSCSTVTQLKEGLNRILCLIPYNVISQSVWECIMPEWLEAIRTEVPDNQLKEFREVLRWVSSLVKSP